MKVVIADTSPLNYLILVDAVEILPRLYGRIFIPNIVLEELINEDAPKEVAASKNRTTGIAFVRIIDDDKDVEWRDSIPPRQYAGWKC